MWTYNNTHAVCVYARIKYKCVFVRIFYFEKKKQPIINWISPERKIQRKRSKILIIKNALEICSQIQACFMAVAGEFC